MQRAIITHKGITVIPIGTYNGAWQTVDIGGLLKHADTKIVKVAKWVIGVGSATVGARRVNTASISDNNFEHALTALRWSESYVMLRSADGSSTGTYIDVSGTNSNARVSIEAEFGGDDVYALSDYINAGANPDIHGDKWGDKDISTVLNNIGCPLDVGVIMTGHCGAAGGWHIRKDGGAFNLVQANNAISCLTDIAQTVNGIFEMYVFLKSGALHGFPLHVGYIKNWQDNDPAHETWVGKNAWQTVDRTTCNNADTGTTNYPDGVVALIGLRNAYNSAPPFILRARSLGSGNLLGTILGGTRYILLQSNRGQRFQIYRNNDVTTNYYVKGWYDATPQLKMDTGHKIIQGQVVIK